VSTTQDRSASFDDTKVRYRDLPTSLSQGAHGAALTLWTFGWVSVVPGIFGGIIVVNIKEEDGWYNKTHPYVLFYVGLILPSVIFSCWSIAVGGFIADKRKGSPAQKCPYHSKLAKNCRLRASGSPDAF